MKVIDLQKQSSTVTDTTTVTLGAALGIYRTVAQAIAAGEVVIGDTIPFIVFDPATGAYEASQFTVTSSTLLTRERVLSNGGTPTAFTAGTKEVYSAVPAALVAQLSDTRDIPFSTVVPLSRVGTAFMPRTQVTSGMTLSAGSGAVRGALAYLRLLGNGTDTPAFSGMLQWGSSADFDIRANIENQVQIFCDGTSVFYSITQAVNAVAVPMPATAITLTGPAGGAVSQASSAFTVATNGTLASSVTVTPSDAGAGGSFSPASVALTSSTTSATFTYTPASTGAKTISVTNNGGLSNPASVTYTVSAAATVPGAPTIGTAVAGDGYVDVAFTAPASNGGAAILDYTATLSTGESATGTASPIRVTAANGTARTATVKARNSAGSSAASAASNSVTPAAATQTTIRLAGSKSTDVVESSAAPWTYTSTGGATGATGAVSSLSIPADGDGEVVWKVNTTSGDFMVRVAQSSTPVKYDAFNAGQSIWSNGGSAYRTFGNKQTTTGTAPATGDLIRFRKKNSAANADYLIDYDWSISKDAGATWTVVDSNTVGSNGMRKQVHYIHVVPGANAVLSVVSQAGFA